jgi:hypothetical protein
MRWTTEKKKLWIKTRLAFGPIYVCRIRVGLTGVKFGSDKFGQVPVYLILFGTLHVNRRGQIVSTRVLEWPDNTSVVYPAYYSVCKAVTEAKKIVAVLYQGRVCPSVSLQTRGILPDHVIDILFDRLRG